MRKGRAGKLYVDGVLVASGESPLGSRTLATTTRFYWGGLPNHLMVEDEDVDVSEMGENLTIRILVKFN